MEKILLYNVRNPEEIVRAADNMRIVTGFVDEKDSYKTLEQLSLAAKKNSLSDILQNKPTEGESLIIFCDVTDKHMDKLLFEIRQKELDITFKAVLTATNKKWNIRQMLVEMRRERFEYMRRNMR